MTEPNTQDQAGAAPPAPQLPADLSLAAPIDRALARTGFGSNRPSRPPNDTRRVVPPPPVDYDPRTVAGDGPASAKARAALEFVMESWRRVRVAAADPRIALADLAKAAAPVVEKALAGVDRARDAIRAEVSAAEASVLAKITPKGEAQLAGEIRDYWRDRGASGTVLAELTAAACADARTASALLSAPGYLSGLTGEQIDVVRTAATHAFAQAEGARLDEARAALDRVSRAGARVLEQLGPKLREWATGRSEVLDELTEMAR